MPTISVVMASYNHEKYINDAISSVMSQKIEDLELIIVDDFSKDNSRYIIHNWVNTDRRVKAIFHEKNEGIARTINDGIKIARGKLIAIMASDDMFKENAFEKIIAVLESSKNCGVAVLEGEYIDQKTRKTGLRFSELHRKPSVEKGSFFRDLITGNFVCTGVVRKSILEKYQIYYNEKVKYLNDWLFWLDLSRVCDFVFIREPLYYYRVHETNTSAIYKNMMIGESLKAIDIVLSKYGEIIDEKSKEKLLRGKGRSCLLLHKYSEARRYLHQCIRLNPSPLNITKTTLQILFTHFPHFPQSLYYVVWQFNRWYQK